MATAVPKPHHVRREVCTTRARYREGRDLKAVKVYTVNQESRYLLVQGIPALGAREEMIQQFALYGAIEEYKIIHGYPSPDFTEVMWIKFGRLQAARMARRKMDDQSFYGGVLHVCYAPEYETLDDTRAKLADRRKSISIRIKKIEQESQISEPVKASQASSQEWSYRNPSEEKTSSRDRQRIPHSYQQFPSNSSQSSHTEPLTHPPSSTNSAIPAQGHAQQLKSNIEAGENPREIFPSLPLPPTASTSNNQSRYRDYRGSEPNLEPTEQFVNVNGREERFVSNYKASNMSKPKFIPRQVQKRGAVSKLLTSKISRGTRGDADPIHTEANKGDTKEGSTAVVKEKVKDRINERLREEAFILRDVKGPVLPADEEERRVTYKLTETGNESYDSTVAEIRKRVREFASIAPPPQLIRKRRKKDKPPESETENK